MGRTIGAHFPPEIPATSFTTCCDYCGCVYYRHQLRRDRSGLLACSTDYGGDIVSLDEANAAAAMRFNGPQGILDGGMAPPRNHELPPPVIYPDGQGVTFGYPPIPPDPPEPPEPPPPADPVLFDDRGTGDQIYDDRGGGEYISP